MDMEHVLERIQDVEERLDQRLSVMEKQVQEIYTALVGEKKLGQMGLVVRLEELEAAKKKWETKANWLYGYVLGAGGVVALIIEVLKEMYKK